MPASLHSFHTLSRALRTGGGLSDYEYTIGQLFELFSHLTRHPIANKEILETLHEFYTSGRPAHVFDGIGRYHGFIAELPSNFVERRIAIFSPDSRLLLKIRKNNTAIIGFIANYTEPNISTVRAMLRLTRERDHSDQESHKSERRITGNTRALRVREAELREICDEGVFIDFWIRSHAATNITHKLAVRTIRNLRSTRQYRILRSDSGRPLGYIAWAWIREPFDWPRRPQIHAWHPEDLNAGTNLIIIELIACAEAPTDILVEEICKCNFSVSTFWVARQATCKQKGPLTQMVHVMQGATKRSLAIAALWARRCPNEY